MADDALGAAVFCCDQRAAAGREIVKTVGLLLALAVEIPAPALVGAAADMRDGVNKTAVDQRQPVDVKRRSGGEAIGAVAVEQQRRGPVALEILPVQDRDRHLSAIMR